MVVGEGRWRGKRTGNKQIITVWSSISGSSISHIAWHAYFCLFLMNNLVKLHLGIDTRCHVRCPRIQLLTIPTTATTVQVYR